MPSIDIEDLSIHYLHHVNPGQAGGQRVLFIHGTGCNARVFARHLHVLKATHEVVAIDLPGHGRSAGAGFRGVADHAAYCAGLIRALGWENCVVAGHSMGGGVALALALYDAELVSALIMIDSGARLRVAPEIIRAARQIAAGAKTVRTNTRRGFATKTTDAVVADVRALTADCPDAVIAKDWIADDTCDFMSRLGAITVPALVICGREDPLTPLKYSEFFKTGLADCTLEVIEDAGHWPFAEQPAVFDECVSRYLARLD